VRFSPRSTVGVSASPFTLQQQVQEYDGELWRVEVELPAMLRSAAEDWITFRLSLRGRLGTFLLGFPDAVADLLGSGAGTPLVDGTAAAGTKTLATKGWTADAANVLLKGDWFSLGSGVDSCLYKVLADVSADSSGEAVVDIFPRLRQAAGDEDPVEIDAPRGAFRMETNEMPWDVDMMKLFGLSFACVGAV
jgi:hypothetical protein